MRWQPCSLPLARSQPHRGEKVIGYALFRARSSGSVPWGQESTAWSPFVHMPAPAAKPVAAFASDTVDDSRAEIPCTINERKALTVIAAVTWLWVLIGDILLSEVPEITNRPTEEGK